MHLLSDETLSKTSLADELISGSCVVEEHFQGH